MFHVIHKRMAQVPPMQQRVGARMPAAAVAAQVAAQDDGPEAAVAASVKALNEIKVKLPFTVNSVALKWIRDSHEDPHGCLTTTIVELTGWTTVSKMAR